MSSFRHSLRSGNFSQDWSNTALIDFVTGWSNIPSIIGFLGDASGGIPAPFDPRLATANVLALHQSLHANETGVPTDPPGQDGVAEIELANPTIALRASDNADFANIVLYMDSTARAEIRLTASLRDIDATNDAVQQINVQYRTSSSGTWINVPGGYFADVTGPGATMVTQLDVTLPPGANNQPELQIRIMTGNALGTDEWVGIDDIAVSSVDANEAPIVAFSPPPGASEVGAEIMVSNGVSGNAGFPSIAGLANGNYVVTWTDLNGSGPDVSGFAIKAQIVGANGVEIGDEFVVNTRVDDHQTVPDVTALANGGFVIAWMENQTPGGPSAYSVKAQIFDAAGARIGGEFLVTSVTAGGEFPDIAGLAGGGFVATWRAYDDGGGGFGVGGQVFSATGVEVSSEFFVNTTTSGNQQQQAVAALDGGGFVVVWRNISTATFQRFDAAGTKLGGETIVAAGNLATTSQPPAIAALDGGGFVIVWANGSVARLKAQTFDAAGVPVGSLLDAGSGDAPSVAGLPDGGFVITWDDGGDLGAQAFSAAGIKIGGEFVVNNDVSTQQTQTLPDIAATANGGFAITWLNADGTFSGTNRFTIRSQLYGPLDEIATEQVPFDLKGYVDVGDPDAGAGVLTVTLSVDYGILIVTPGASGATVAGSGTATVEIEGTLAQLQALLGDGGTGSVQFLANTFSPPASVALTVTVNDNGNTGVDPGQTGDGTSEEASASITITIRAAPDAPAARPDAVSTDETTAVSGNVFADNGAGADSDPEGDPLVVAAVNGSAAAVGNQITLPSGALLTLNANGSFTYNPNGAFDATPAPGSGASNTPAFDSFTYTLAGGGTATVTVTIGGVDSNDRLLGTGGNDVLAGGLGNDRYVVENAGDAVIETAGEGDDSVTASVSYALAAGASVETLATTLTSGSEAINLTGNEIGQSIFGNQGNNVLLGGGGVDQLTGYGGNDVLVGGAGVDYLRGGLGNDVYGIDEGDVIFELAGEGDDSLAANIGSYFLNAGASIETLSTANQAGTAAQNLTGNELGQTVAGSEGANVLNGGLGNDLLRGYGGADIFLFDTSAGASNHDVIADMAVGADKIALQNSVFTGLAEGNLGANQFVIGSAAQDADDRIIWNAATSQLFYDADGNGAGAAVLFAIVNGSPNLQASDFIIV